MYYETNSSKTFNTTLHMPTTRLFKISKMVLQDITTQLKFWIADGHTATNQCRACDNNNVNKSILPDTITHQPPLSRTSHRDNTIIMSRTSHPVPMH